MDKKDEIVGSATSNLVTLNDLTYPLSSMTSWTDANYGACGTSYYFTGLCHNGADLAAPIGTPVYAISDGTVIIKSATQDTGSNCVSSGWGYDSYNATSNPTGTNTCNMGLLIKHYDASGQPFVAIYGHLRYSANLAVGDTFTAGQQIGVIGRWPYGSHLHFGIFPNANTPLSGFGRMPCSTSQDASITFPQGCSSNGFVPPGTFITSHFPASAPFDHHDPPTVCENEPTPDGSWYYTCSERGSFEEGEDIWVLLRLHQIDVNHQFRVKAYKNNAYQWDWTTNTNNVGSSTWQYSHFWPELSNATIGKWRFDLFLVPEGGPEIFVETASFQVFAVGTLPPAQGGGGFESIYPGMYYYYDGNGYTCPGPIEGGASTNWVYTCGLPRTTFEQGETVNGLIRLDNISADFRFSLNVYKDSAYQWNHTTSWNDVGQWGWSKSYFPIVLEDASPGNWEFRVSVDEGSGFELLDTLSFAMTPDPTPFEYGGLATCSGPVTGGAGTDWVYTCENATESFSASQTAIALARIDNIMADFRWKADVYINGTYQWNHTTDWNDVGEWGWSKAYFSPTTSSVWAGNWEYRIYLDTGNGFQYLDTAYFVVN